MGLGEISLGEMGLGEMGQNHLSTFVAYFFYNYYGSDCSFLNFFSNR